MTTIESPTRGIRISGLKAHPQFAWVAGARFDGGWLGVAVILLAAVLLTCVFGAFSNAMALLAKAQAAGRGALQTAPDWAAVWGSLGFLSMLAVVMTWLATRAFRVYRRSL
ncbi:hypothetical protein ACT3TS_08530 [Specibacter sp. AOP5-B1-6]|uniref:hypothetical protein n=1 Tax=Specibacter sp. AOP5-B1-6 TaxID=3457653 RepID=UPI00402BCFF9